MTARLQVKFRTLVLATLTLTVVVFAVLNLQQSRKYVLADDGVAWVDAEGGVSAWAVDPTGAGARAGVREGDLLVEINGHPVTTTVDVAKELARSGVGSQAAYELARGGGKIEARVTLAAAERSVPLRTYLELVGLAYLFIGAFIFLRRWTAPSAVHLYLFCLASFVLYTFSYTGKLNLFDSTIYWMNVAAWVLQPALFLHFCLRFPRYPRWLRERRALVSLAYLPGALIGAFHALVMLGIVALPMPLLMSRWLVDRIELGYLAAFFVLGAGLLETSYRRATVPLSKQQLKWVSRGAWLAILPFGLLYALPYAVGMLPTGWMKLSVFSLVFLPLTFGYAILRYRLMDVDIIFRRGVAYTLATAAIVGFYFGLVFIFADLFRAAALVTSRGGWIVAIIVTALLFQPLVNWIQARLDRLFNRERYNYRRTLLEFARELTSELHVGRLLDRVVEHLAETLGVDHLAVFLAGQDGEMRLAKSRGIAFEGELDLSYLEPMLPELAKGYLFFESVRRPPGYEPAAQATIERLDLHYYLPFKMNERTLGYLGLGKTRKGDYLSSEDVDLLLTITGYVTIAMENARLYESLEHKALEYQKLKDFNENIIESTSVGVVAADLEGRIGSWNSAMEQLYGLPRAEAVGRRLGEVLPADLLVDLPAAGDPKSTAELYKFRLRTAAGRARTVNLSLAPLVGKDERVIGRLFIFNDITERVSLEEQLVQAEKLSSVGLLAAGVAHEVNTPLSVISSQAQLLAKQLPSEDPHRGTLEKIIRQSFRASEIVNNLLKFSRVSGSEATEVDLNKALRETLSLVEPMLRASKITLNLQLTECLPPVLGSFGKLQQVFMNLIVNAKDAMPYGGELTISSEQENSTVRVEVADNGVGIPAENLNRIFDPFFTTKSTTRGTGLGLAVSYGIIREHGGKILVESAVGKGSSFRLEFPLTRKPVNVS